MGCFADCLKCFSAGIAALILLAATLGISVTSVVLGATNLNSNCTGISQIPAYLITTGVLGIVIVILWASEHDSEDKDSEKKKDSLFTQLLRLGNVGVLIWGSVILFGVERPNCDTVLFDYAFAITITAYAILALIILIGCFAMISACCRACTDHCCGDGDGELTYEFTCCGYSLCADNTTNAKKQSTTTSDDVVIEMPSSEMPSSEMPRIEMPRVGRLNRGTEC